MNLHVGARVRIVEMNGCMAHVKENPREGTVVDIRRRKLYGGGDAKYLYATIKLDNGGVVEKPAESRFWTMHDGLPEYGE